MSVSLRIGLIAMVQRRIAFSCIAKIWSSILRVEIKSWEVALMMAGLKIARAAYNPDHEDNWIDLAGYAACGGEIATTHDKGDEHD